MRPPRRLVGVELGLPPFALVAIEAVVGISVQVVRNSSATSSYLRKVATLICGHRHTYARARPSTTPGQQLESALLDAARDELVEVGHANLTMESVAA